MYFSYKFTDAETKQDVVKHNTKEMIFAYFWSALQIHSRHFTGMKLSDIDQTKQIISVWVNDNPTASLIQLSDFVSGLVDSYEENMEDLAERPNWEE